MSDGWWTIPVEGAQAVTPTPLAASGLSVDSWTITLTAATFDVSLGGGE